MERRTDDLSRKLLATILIVLFYLAPLAVPEAWSGPPFITDNPEPVEYRHSEFYTAFQYANNKDGEEAALPHFEFNYGAFPDGQVHLVIPFAYARRNGGPAEYGLGDTEAGVLYRFIHETGTLPQAGVFPTMHIPSGDSDRGLGSGHIQFFLPLWIQKSRGPWTTSGGGGYWTNPGAGNKDFWQLSWLAQRDITESLTLGAEIFYFGKDSDDGREHTGYNIGAILNLSEEHHVLFSAGSDIAGDNRFSAYLGYLWTFGPSKNDGPRPK